MPRMRIGLASVAAVALLALTGCGSSNNSSSSSAGGGATTSGAATTGAATGTGTSAGTGTSGGSTGTSAGGVTADVSSCGPKPGVKATGTPINIGTIDTHQPGTDFTDGPNMIQAYFNCVNDNGGVNGHPLKLFVELDQTQPAQIAAAAQQADPVRSRRRRSTACSTCWSARSTRATGSSSASTRWTPGSRPECWSTPNSAAVNMGPRYSSDGAVQYALDVAKAKKIVFVQSNVPGTGYIAAGPAAIAKSKGVPITSLTENVPINDANSVALNLVNSAGPDGWVVLNFTPPEALVILQAAQKLGLEDRVKGWGCSTPCDTDFLAKALGPKWNHKLFVNAEAANAGDHNGPEMQNYKAIVAKYGQNVAGGIGSFSQFGYLLAKFLTQALETVKGDYTIKSVNAAILGIKDYKSEHALPAVDVREGGAAYPEQLRLHGDAR